MNDASPDLLRQLVSSAMPYTASLVEPSNNPSKHDRSDRAKEFSGIQDGVSVVKFLMTQGAIKLDEYTEWNRCAIAFKNSYGEDGYSAWQILSASVDNYDGEEACRKEWMGSRDDPMDQCSLSPPISRRPNSSGGNLAAKQKNRATPTTHQLNPEE